MATYNKQAPFIEAGQENYLDLLTQLVGQAPGSNILDADGNVTGTVPTLGEMGPQIANQNALTQAAQQAAATQAGLGQLTFGAEGQVTGAGQGTGVAGYQPYMDQAGQYQTAAAGFSGPNAYKDFMSPYQQDVIDTTLAEYDQQAKIGAQGTAADAISAGAFGGGREGVAKAQYQSDSDRNRATTQAGLLQQGFTQANQLANQAYKQQMDLGGFSQNLASLQPSLAATNIQNLGAAGNSKFSLRPGFTRCKSTKRTTSLQPTLCATRATRIRDSFYDKRHALHYNCYRWIRKCWTVIWSSVCRIKRLWFGKYIWVNYEF